MKARSEIPPDKGPLADVLIVDLSTALAVPLATAMLADQGAQVIKVESPGIGDILRYVGLSYQGLSCPFQAANRGKRGLGLDIKSAEGRETLRAFIKRADVVTHNFRPGVPERLGIDYEELRQINPQLVYLSVTGYGAKGPRAKHRAYDNVVQAFSGLTMNQINIETQEPTPNYQAIADKLTSMNAYQAITAALFARERGRGGQQIEIAMMDCVVSFLWPEASKSTGFLDDPDSVGGIDISEPIRLTRFKNGWGNFAPLSDSEFFGACRAFGVDVEGDERVTNVVARAANGEAMAEIMERIALAAADMDVDEAMRRLEKEDVPCAKSMSIRDLPQHPQFEANQSFVRTEHPQAGTLCEPRGAARFSTTPSGVGAPSPSLGQHSDELLREFGHTNEQITALREAGVVV